MCSLLQKRRFHKSRKTCNSKTEHLQGFLQKLPKPMPNQCHNPPLGRRNKKIHQNTTEVKGINMEEEYEGIPRSKIPWDPKIDPNKCTTCGKCVEFCHTGAFELREKNGKKQTVVKPNTCVVFCRGCEDICPSGAITHPNEAETRKAIDNIKNGK
jgi:NAD-dependent dihydropyrimidine dehydrogenase PreA subunit